MRVIVAVAAAALLALAPVTAATATPGPARAVAADARTADEHGAVSVLANPYDGITVTVGDSLFFADRSTFHVTVTNTHTYQISVPITAWAYPANRLDIDGTPVTVTVPPGAQADAEFPATAVTNGAVTVSAAIVGADGIAAPGTISTATFTVQAGWETPIVLVIAAIVLVLAILGVIRTVRRVRRARAETASDHAPLAADATTDVHG